MSTPTPTDASTAIPIPGMELSSDGKYYSKNTGGDLKRRVSNADSLTVATGTYSSKASSSDYTASTAGSSNIWTRLLSSESVWDSLNVVHNSEDDEQLSDYDYEEKKAWHPSGLAVVGLSMWYEIKHFFKTVAAHPHIWLVSLAVGGIVAGVGMWAVTNEKDAYVQDRMQTAEFVARETATYFSNEFKRAFLPLYSLREAVTHSGYFDDMAYKIGRYPNLLKENDVEFPGGLANLRNVEGICDDENVLEKWDELVSTSTSENDLDGMIVRYRLMPRNVACLDYKKGQAMVDSGMDMSNSGHPFWSMVTTDLFVNQWPGLHVFGPFMAGEDEMFCTHLGIWTKPENKLQTFNEDGTFSLENTQNSYTNIKGTEVENVWGFVMNYLNWGEMKKRSKIYERFANVNMDFELSRLDEDVAMIQDGPKGEPTKNFGMLAKSENSHLLDDSNSIVIETDSLHGIWTNRVGIASENGWNPEWWWPAVASVIVAAVLLGFLTAATLVKGQLHRDLVEKMMPKKAIKKLQRGQTVIEKYNLVTVFYADLVGFSGAKNTMSPVQVMNMLNDLYTELDKIAKRHGVYKVETVGNRYMVVGGAPNQESARVAAKRVALFAIDAMAFVDNIFLTTNGDKLYIRAGIASGPAVAGCVGKAMPHYTFFGDTIDLASRLEKTSKKMKLQCSEVTYRLLHDAPGMKFVFTKRVDKDGNVGVDIKGRGNHVTWWLEKASPCNNCFELTKGSYILDPCGHVLCAKCNDVHNLNVCPTCRCKVDGRTEWAGVAPNKIVDIENASFDMMESGTSEAEESED